MFSPRRMCILAFCALNMLTVSCGGGRGSTDDSYLYPLWVETDVQVVDIDGDGRPDVLTLAMLSSSSSQREGRFTVRLQTAPGVFAPAQSYVVGIYPTKMAVGDVDGDGAPDVVISDAGGMYSATGYAVWMLRQDAGNRGYFLAAQRLMPTSAADIAIGDVNGDNVPDIVLADSLTPDRGATVLYQDAARRGTFFAPVSISLPGDATQVAIGDMNGDGRNDLVFRMFLSETNYVQSHSLGIVYQQPGGVLGPVSANLSPQTGLNSAMLAITDYNGDGAADIVEFFTPSSTDFRAKVTTLLQSKAAGFFSAVDTSLAVVNYVDSAAVTDLNGDGLPDLAVVGYYPVGSPTVVYSALSIFMQNGSGAFTLATSIEMPVASDRIAAGDINGDGLTDLVVLGGDNEVFVLLQSTTVHGTFLAPNRLN